MYILCLTVISVIFIDVRYFILKSTKEGQSRGVCASTIFFFLSFYIHIFSFACCTHVMYKLLACTELSIRKQTRSFFSAFFFGSYNTSSVKYIVQSVIKCIIPFLTNARVSATFSLFIHARLTQCAPMRQCTLYTALGTIFYIARTVH